MSTFEPRYIDGDTILQEVPAITTITILNTARTIFGLSQDLYAFKKATNTLKSFDFQQGSEPQLENINSYSFYNCVVLEAADFSRCSHLNFIGEYAFSKCSAMKTLKLPDSINEISAFAFSEAGITSLYLPIGIKKLGSWCFNKCSALEIIEFAPEINIPSFQDHVFAECLSLVSITLPKLFSISNGNIFTKCTSLMNIYVADGNTNIRSAEGVLMSFDNTDIISMPAGRTGTYEIIKTVDTICVDCFVYTKLTRVIFPPNLTSMASWCFAFSEIGEIDLPSSLTVLKDNVFTGCCNLHEVVLKNGLEEIGPSCFSGCINLKKVIIPETLTTLGGGVFKGCHADINISFAEGSKYFLDENFFITNRDKTVLSQYIGQEKNITIPNSVTVIQSKAFSYDDLISVSFGPDTKIQDIQESAFFNNVNLVSIDFPSTLKTISSQAFEGCVNLNVKVEFRENFEYLGEYAFSNCKKITLVRFSSSPLTTIGKCAFCNCTCLSQVIFSDKIKTISEEAFQNCISIQYLEILSSVEKVGNSAFAGSGIVECEFSESKLTIFSDFMFYKCYNLTKINFPPMLESIGIRALSYTNLTRIDLTYSIKTLNEYCFEGCQHLTTFTIPSESQLESIGFGIFSQCKIFKEIISNSPSKFVVDQTALYNAKKTIFYILPPASPIKYFSFPATVTEINSGALFECNNLAYVFISETITKIGISAFEGCTSLKTINIPSTVKTIEKNAFARCKSLTCDLSIETRNDNYIQMLVDAKIPHKCLLPCNVNTCKYNLRIQKSLFTLFLILIL